MRPGPRAWLSLALLTALGRAALGAVAVEDAPPARLPDAAGSILLSPPAPIAQFPVLALEPAVASPAPLAPMIAAPSVPLALPAAAVDERAASPAPEPALKSGAADEKGEGASAPAGSESESAGAAKLFDGGAEAPDAVAAPEPTFEERRRFIRVASTLGFSTGPKSRSVLDWRKSTIDGLPAEEIDGLGVSNAGVYRYVRDGRRRVLKILTQHVGEDYPENLPAYPAQTQLRAGAVGSVFGAPRILRTGTIRNGPYENYFIEMEERFPGESTRGFKDTVDSPEKAAWVKSLAVPSRSGESPAVRIARMIVEVMEHGVVPYDADFLVTKDGRVSWIDANFWGIDDNARFPKYREKLLRETNYFLRSFAEDPAAGRIFAREFFSALKRSRRIPDQTKEAVLDNWAEHDPGSMDAVGISGRTMLRSFYDGLR